MTAAIQLPNVRATVERLEDVRRFISKCLNLGLQRRMKKLKPGQTLSDHEREALEIDYGTIPKVKRPFLKQPGAEKILLWLHVRPVYETVTESLGEGHIEVISRCRLLSTSTGQEVFSGPTCSCSSMESNFRFRWEERDEKTPKPTREQGEELKKAGLGRWKFQQVYTKGKAQYDGSGKPIMEWAWYDRIENPNIHDERNKVRQQSEKRALVKAVRNFGALSEIFVEDPADWEFPEDYQEAPAIEEEPRGRVVAEELSSGVQGAVPEGAGPKSPPRAQPWAPPKKIITVSWTLDKKFAGVGGDPSALTTIVPDLKRWRGEWLEEDKCWAIPAIHVVALEERCEIMGYGYQELTSALSSPKKQAEPAAASSQTGGVERQAHTPTPTPAAGLIQKIKEDVKGKKGSTFMEVLWNGVWHYCFNQHLWEYIRLGQQKEAEFIVDKARGFPTIVGIRRIANRKFDEDGVTPIVDMKEERPKKGSLFA